MLDVVKRVARSIIYCELGHYEPSGQLVVNDMGIERREEHVIQPSADRVKWGSSCQYFRLLLPW